MEAPRQPNPEALVKLAVRQLSRNPSTVAGLRDSLGCTHVLLST